MNRQDQALPHLVFSKDQFKGLAQDLFTEEDTKNTIVHQKRPSHLFLVKSKCEWAFNLFIYSRINYSSSH